MVAVMEIEGQGLQEFTTYIVPVSADDDVENFFNRRAEETEARIEPELIPGGHPEHVLFSTLLNPV